MPRPSRLTFEEANADDTPTLAALHTAVAAHLTEMHGEGPWSAGTSAKGILQAMRNSRVYVARQGGEIVGAMRLTTKKPWAIDTKYFSKCSRPLYLLGMAVPPQMQRRGVGRRCLEEARRIARAWPADAIRLDAYDAAAGAGGFYARCGYAERGKVTYRNAPLIYYELLLEAAQSTSVARG